MQVDEPTLSVAALDQAAETILKHNFDADSKVCVVTLMKVLDNVIQKPYDTRVRRIKLSNAAVHKKILSRKGGVDFLLACGFRQDTLPLPPLSKPNQMPESVLVLTDIPAAEEDNTANTTGDDEASVRRKEAYTTHIITARRLLLTRATKDLKMKADELPAYKPPPPPISVVGSASHAGAKMTDANSFDPYQTHRYDGMSAATGAQMTPGQNYVSTTEKQLQTLQNKQAQLEQKMQQPLPDRAWVATMPNASGMPTAVIASHQEDNNHNDKGTGSLIAAQFQKQQEQRRQREEGGFTTKTMRELEKLKKQKVYAHTQLALQFSDGTVLQGKFLPKEKVRVVLKELKECFVEAPATLELYITPPRKTLAPTSSLQEEGLVPAAKVFVKTPLPSRRPFLKPELFATTTPTAAFPAAQSIVASKDKTAKSSDTNSTAKPAAKPSAEDKEAALLQRMMGGGRTLGGGKKIQKGRRLQTSRKAQMVQIIKQDRNGI